MLKISVIMGIFNCEDTIKSSIESIINQTYKNWEFIICDDGSTDKSYSIALEYSKKHSNITVIKNEINMGLNKTLNKCINYASGEIIARMDGDDISLSDRFEKQIWYFDKTNYTIVSSSMIRFDEKGDWGKTTLPEFPQKKDFTKGTPFCHAASMVKKDALLSVGGYSESPFLIRVEDYHLWFKLYKNKYIGYNIQEPLYKMRDDRKALKRRTLKSRINEMYVMFIGYKMLRIPLIYYPFILKPLMIALLPNFVYNYFHKKF